MSFWKQGRNHNDQINNSRINLIIAIIFLLAGAVVYKLFYLQVINQQYYYDLAVGQHQVYSELLPRRGRIFIQNDTAGDSGQLYPLATNKNFVLLYAVPKNVKEPEIISQELYKIFDRAKTEKKVDDFLAEEDANNVNLQIKALGALAGPEFKVKAEEIKANFKKLKADAKWREIRAARRQAEIELRQKTIAEAYLKKLKKPGDVYEPLRQKVEEADLKKLYLAVARPGGEIKIDDLEIEANGLFIINHGARIELAVSGLGFSLSAYRFYPEANIGANLIGFLGYDGDELTGRYGLEEFFNQELAGRPGSIKVERDAKGDAIIINDREYQKAEDGDDLILTINRSIQYLACQKLNQAVLKHGADGGSVIIMEPTTGAILAMCGSPDYDGNNYQTVADIRVYTNPAIFSQYEPGSIFKAITMAMALDQGKVTPQTTYEDTGQVKLNKYTIENSDRKANGTQNMRDVLNKSLNTGAIFAMRQIGPDIFADYLKNFGFGEKTGIELAGESKGDIKSFLKKPVGEIYAATAAFGQGIAVTPLQMISAFQALANNGWQMKPYLVKEIVKPDGSRITAAPTLVGRAISEKAATIIDGMLVDVVENGHGKKAGVAGYYVAGKTGTAQVPKKGGGYKANSHIGSFAGFAPVSNPKFVMLVRIDRPRDVEWAESSAAPLFGELAEYMLNYWQVPKERNTAENNK